MSEDSGTPHPDAAAPDPLAPRNDHSTDELDRQVPPVLTPLAPGSIESLLCWLSTAEDMDPTQRKLALEIAGWSEGTGNVLLRAVEDLTRPGALKPIKSINRRTQRAWALGVDLAVLSARKQAQPSYQLLIEMVHRLDRDLRRRARRTVRFYKAAAALPMGDQQRERRIERAQVRQRAVVREAVDRFVDLVSPEVRNVYFRNEETNRVSLMPPNKRRPDGLRWPEAMQGLSMFNDAPRAVLLDDDHDPAWNDTELAELFKQRPDLPGRGRFAWREKTTKTWAFRIAWDRSRVTAFCSWRERVPAPAPAPSELLRGLGMTPVREQVRKEAWSDPRVADLALRYLTGWLRSTGLHVTGQGVETGEKAKNVRLIITAMLEQPTPGWGTLGTALDNCTEDPCPIWTVNAVNKDEQGQWLVHHHPDHYPDRTTPIVPGTNDVLVNNGNNGSIAAQAACWDTPLLLNNLGSLHPHREGWSWREQDLPIEHPEPDGKKVTTGSEIAAVVPGRNAPYAVLVGEHPEPGFFKPAHLHRAQLIGMLAGACRDCQFGENAGADHKAKQAKALRAIAKSRAESTGDLLVRFTETIRTLAKADLCYVLRYNPVSRCFFAASIAACKSLLDDALVKALPALAERPSSGDLAPLLSLALRAAIQPAGKGRSWEVYRRMRCIAQVDEPETKPLGAPLDMPFPTRITLPLAAGSGAAADAVLWLRWRSTPSALFGGADQSPDELTRAVGDRTGCVTAVLAAALALLGPQSSR